MWSGILGQAITFVLVCVSIVPPLWMSRTSYIVPESKTEDVTSSATDEEVAKPKLPRKFYELHDDEMKVFANTLALEFSAENLKVRSFNVLK